MSPRAAQNAPFVINHLRPVSASVVLQSAAALTASFLDDGSEVVNTTAKTITVPKASDARFYRLRYSVPTRIMSIQMVGTNVVMGYQ